MSVCGWLAPNGTFHSCHSYSHSSLGYELIKLYYKDVGFYEDSEEVLYSKGFIKFTFGDVYMFSQILYKRIDLTDKQLDFVANSKGISKEQHFQITTNMRVNTKMPKRDIFQGDNELIEYQEPRTIHTIDEYPPSTKYIKITTNIPVNKIFKPNVGSVYPVIKEGGKYEHLYFILVNGEEIGIYPHRECKLVKESKQND